MAVLWILVWMSLVKFPDVASVQLDTSWQMTLAYAASQHLQFGPEIVFTYGPLGFLLSAVNIGQHYTSYVVWQILSNAVFALTIVLLGGQLKGWRRATFYAFFFFFGSLWLDQLFLLMIFVMGIAMIHPSLESRSVLPVVIAVVLGAISLAKFVNLVLAAFIVACVVAFYLRRGRWARASMIMTGYVASIVCTWTLLGQGLGNFPAYLRNSLSLAGSYTAGMSIEQKPIMTLLGLVTSGLIAVYYLLSVRNRDERLLASTMTLIAAATSFICWKHGFVRSDFHVTSHFFMCLFVAVTFPSLLADSGPGVRTKGIVLGLCALLSVIGIFQASSTTVTDALAAWNYRLKAVAGAVLNPSSVRRSAQEQFRAAQTGNVLPAIKQLIGRNSVDVIGHEQGVAIFNDLNFRPRPIFQSYSAYGEDLLRLNEDYYRSDDAPEFVLQKVQTIDDRLYSLDDSLVTRHLYRHYSWITEEKGFLIWQKNPFDPLRDVTSVVSTRSARFGATVDLGSQGEKPLWVKVGVKPNLLGKIRSFLYKPPILHLKTTDEHGQTSYRLIGDMARAGFLAYPHFTRNEDIVRYESGLGANRLTAIAVEIPESDRKYFRSEIHVELSSLVPFPQSGGTSVSAVNVKFDSPIHPIVAARAYAPISRLTEQSREVVLSHPPSELEFRVNETNHHFQAMFGIASSAYAAPNATDGVEFVAEWTGPDSKPVIVFSKLLRPTSVEADRGSQRIDIVLGPGAGRLKLRTTSGPANNLAFDWAYWGELRFTP